MKLQESEVWHLDQVINDRGIRIDSQLVNALIQIDETQRGELMRELQNLTDLENPNSRNQLLAWLQDHGEDIPDLQKDTIAKYQPKTAEAAAVIHIRKQISQSASKKLIAMRDSVNSDGRARGLLMYYGAGQTGRWAGRRIQPQNMPRGTHKVTPSLIEAAMTGDYDWLDLLYGPDVQGAIGSLLRACITADHDCQLVVADYSAIEARVLAWLAGEEWVLEEFRGDGKIYEATAAKMYGVDKSAVTKDQRQNGKGATLGCGFAGGPGAVKAFGIAEDIAEKVVNDWRKANPNIVKYWATIWNAATNAVMQPRKTKKAGRIEYRSDGFGLWCKLPSGRKLCYPGARMKGNNIEIDGGKRIWRGIIIENAVQAIARDLLADALLQAEAEGLRVVLHVHDEIVVESSTPEDDYAALVEIMSNPPSWADGLPLNAEGYIAERYKK